MELQACFRELIGKWVTPPRIEAFQIGAQKYLLISMNDEEKFIEIKFESATRLRLHYWRFELILNYLSQANGRFIMIGSKVYPETNTTIEGMMVDEARTKGYKYANLRTAPFVCDMIVLCGYAEYGYMVNQKTGRRVQGIRWIK